MEEPNKEPAKPEGHTRQVWKGIGLLALLHLLNFLFPIALFFISVTQLLYLIPALILCRKNKGMMQGLLIGAGVTVLINVACFGIVLGNY